MFVLIAAQLFVFFPCCEKTIERIKATLVKKPYYEKVVQKSIAKDMQSSVPVNNNTRFSVFINNNAYTKKELKKIVAKMLKESPLPGHDGSWQPDKFARKEFLQYEINLFE